MSHRTPAALVLAAGLVAAVGCGGSEPTRAPAPPPPVAPTPPPSANTRSPVPFPADIVAAWEKAGGVVGWMRIDPRAGGIQFVGAHEWKDGDLPALHLIADGNKLTELPVPAIPFGLLLQSRHCTDASVKDIAGWSNLRYLRFSLTKNVTAAGLRELRPLAGLRLLDLGGSVGIDITDTVLAALRESDQLHKLANVTAADQKRPEKPADIVVVNLAGTKVTDAGLKELSGFTNLETLTLNLTDAGAKELWAFPRLHTLVPGRELTDAAAPDLAALPALKSLTLSRTPLTDAGVKHLAGAKSLTTLALDGTKITDDGLTAVAEIPGLVSLTLDRTAVTDASVAKLGTKLKVLTLESTRVGDPALRAIAKMDGLEFLALSGTAVTDAGVKELRGLKNLKILRLVATARVSEAVVKDLRTALPECQISWGVPRY